MRKLFSLLLIGFLFSWLPIHLHAGGCGPGGVGIMCQTPIPLGGSMHPGLDAILLNSVVGRSSQIGGAGPSRQSQFLESLLPKPVTAPASLVEEAVRKIRQNPYQPFALPPVAVEAYKALNVNPLNEQGANVFAINEVAMAPIVVSPLGFSVDTNAQLSAMKMKGLGPETLGINMHTHPIRNDPFQAKLFSGLNAGTGAGDLGYFLNQSDLIEILKVRVGSRELGYALVKPEKWTILGEVTDRTPIHELHDALTKRGISDVKQQSVRTYFNEEEEFDKTLVREEQTMIRWAKQMGVSFHKMSPKTGMFHPLFGP